MTRHTRARGSIMDRSMIVACSLRITVGVGVVLFASRMKAEDPETPLNAGTTSKPSPAAVKRGLAGTLDPLGLEERRSLRAAPETAIKAPVSVLESARIQLEKQVLDIGTMRTKYRAALLANDQKEAAQLADTIKGARKAAIEHAENPTQLFSASSLNPRYLKVGDIGTIPNWAWLKVAQVIDADSRRILVRYEQPDVASTLFMVTGIDSSNMTDDMRLPVIPYLMVVSKTITYETVIGGSKTVLLVEPVSIPPLEDIAKRLKSSPELPELTAKESEAASEALQHREETRAEQKDQLDFKLATRLAMKPGSVERARELLKGILSRSKNEELRKAAESLLEKL